MTGNSFYFSSKVREVLKIDEEISKSLKRALTMFALFCLTTKNAKNTKEKEQKNFALFVLFVVNSSLVGTNLQR